jgi:hypothetical protein
VASFRQHCDECSEALGEPFEHVHRWLDEFAGEDKETHRARRHHSSGVSEVRRMWGDRAAKAAEMHIVTDFGFVPTPDQAGKWRLGGSERVPEGGASFLTDKEMEE